MPHKRIAVIGQPGAINGCFEKTSEQLFKECGLNTGNLAFWYAMNRHIEGNKSFLGWGVKPEFLKHNFDAVVFPAANQLNPDWDMGILADLFEKADLPLIICGLGVQAKNISEKPQFKPGSKRFMKVISERAVSVGVRGEFTAEVMQANGVNNVEVIGCPSNFISCEENLGILQERQLRSLSQIDTLALNLDITESMSDLMRTAFSWGQQRNAMYVNQAPEALVKMANGDFSAVEQGTINRIHNILCPQLTTADFKQFVKSQFKVFFSAAEWMNQLRSVDLSVGTRMHGNMLAWQTKTPCILFPHDSRTHELADLMQLPYVMSNQITANAPLEDVLQKVNFNGVKYDQRRALLLDKYVSLLSRSNVDINPALRQLHSSLSGNKEHIAA